MEANLRLGLPYLILVSLATVTGTVGNFMIIGAVITNKKLQKVGNAFIVNLALTDLCITSVVDPFSIIGIVRGYPWFAPRRPMCVGIASFCLTACFCSLLSITAISINRFIYICHNEYYQRIYTMLNTVLMCLALWVMGFLLELPALAGWSDHAYDNKTMSCLWDRTYNHSYNIFFASAGVAFPILLVSFFYLKIFLYVRKQKKALMAFDNNKKGHLKNSQMKLAKTLFIIFVVFVISWLPYAVIIVADVNDSFPQEFHMFSILFAHINSSLNCILYGLQDQNFREGYMRLLGIKKCHKNRVQPSEVTMTESMHRTEQKNVPSVL